MWSCEHEVSINLRYFFFRRRDNAVENFFWREKKQDLDYV